MSENYYDTQIKRLIEGYKSSSGLNYWKRNLKSSKTKEAKDRARDMIKSKEASIREWQEKKKKYRASTTK